MSDWAIRVSPRHTRWYHRAGLSSRTERAFNVISSLFVVVIAIGWSWSIATARPGSGSPRRRRALRLRPREGKLRAPDGPDSMNTGPINATIRKFGHPASLVREFEHWLVLVRPAQVQFVTPVTLSMCIR